MEENVDSGGKKSAEKGKTKPEEAEEKSFWDDTQEDTVKKTVVEDTAAVPSKAKVSLTEPEVIEEKSIWDDMDDDGKPKKPKKDEVDAPKASKGRKSITEPEVAEEKSIWDDNNNEQNKKPIVEEPDTEPQAGKKTRTQAEVIEEVPIDEDLKTPKRKSVKKESLLEEPLSAESEGINKLRASRFSLQFSQQL